MVEAYGRKVENPKLYSNDGGRETMGLSLKNPEVLLLVKKLATLKGISQAAAVKLAVRNELEIEKRARECKVEGKLTTEIDN